MPEMTVGVFLKQWEEQIEWIKNQTLDERAVCSIALRFDTAKLKLKMLLSAKDFEESDAYMQLELLEAKLHTALETARSRGNSNRKRGIVDTAIIKKEKPDTTSYFKKENKEEMLAMDNKKQIFISHSSKDDQLIGLTELAFCSSDIVPYFAGRQIVGKSPVEKIIDAIEKSRGLFAYITPNSTTDQHARDWINFELGAAKMRKIPIFCLIDKLIAERNSFPELIKGITDYEKFDSSDEKDCRRIVKVVHDRAINLPEVKATVDVEDKTNFESEKFQVSMSEAKIISLNFVKNTKPQYTTIEIASIEPKNDGWEVKGETSKRGASGIDGENFTLLIKGDNVISFKFETALHLHASTGPSLFR
jgi:hypothetical protein